MLCPALGIRDARGLPVGLPDPLHLGGVEPEDRFLLGLTVELLLQPRTPPGGDPLNGSNVQLCCRAVESMGTHGANGAVWTLVLRARFADPDRRRVRLLPISR